MHSPFRRGMRRASRTAQTMLSQIIVSVAAAICVALITNAYLDKDKEPSASAVELSPAQVKAAALPPLDMEVIADIPPVTGAAPGAPSAEIFPGVPVGVTPEMLREKLASEAEPKRRRFRSLPLPFAPEADKVARSTADAAAVNLVSGG